MRAILGWSLVVAALPLVAFAQEAAIKEVHNTLAVRGSIIANMLRRMIIPLSL